MRYKFLEFTLDTAARSLTCAGQPLRLLPKAFDLLSLLVRERHRVVTRKEIYDVLWPDTYVVDANLTVLVREIRTAIRDTRRDVITTVHGTGYRFSAAVRQLEQRSEIDSIAVLPLVNATGEPSLDCVAEGIADTIINRLALIPLLRVMSRSASFRYRGTAAAARDVRRDLSVASVMLGSLARRDGETAATIELVDASDRLILSRTYVRRDAELPALAVRIAADIAEHITTELDAGVRADILKIPTADPDAYVCYLHAREYLNRFDPASLHESIRWNERAVAADPDFAAAYSDLARAYLQLGIYFDSAASMMPLALRNARRALDIDSTLADAHVNLGVIHFIYEWDWDAAQRELFVTSELHPRTAEAFSCASHVLEAAGHNINPEHFIRQGLAADPRSIPLLTELGCNSYAHRRYDVAISEFREALEVDPRNPVAYWGLGRSYAQQAVYAEALEELRKVEEINGFAPPIVTSEIGYVLGRSGNEDAARDVIDSLLRQRESVYIDPYLIAIVYLGMGKSDDALAWLETAFDEKSGFAIAIKSEPKWDPVRNDSRFAALLQRVRLHP